MIYLGTNRGLLSSNDDGETWNFESLIFLPTDSGLPNTQMNTYSPDYSSQNISKIQVLGNEIFFSTGSGKIYQSKNEGKSWRLFFDMNSGPLFGFEMVKVYQFYFLKPAMFHLIKLSESGEKLTTIKLEGDLKANGRLFALNADSIYLFSKEEQFYSMCVKNCTTLSKTNIGFKDDFELMLVSQLKKRLFYMTNKGLYIEE